MVIINNFEFDNNNYYYYYKYFKQKENSPVIHL